MRVAAPPGWIASAAAPTRLGWCRHDLRTTSQSRDAALAEVVGHTGPADRSSMRSMTTPDVEPSPGPGSSGRTLARVQFALAAVYVGAIGVALGRAASFSGYLYLPRQGDEYTGNANLWPGLWAAAALAMIVVIGLAPYAAAVAAIVAVTRLLTAGVRTSAHRRSLIVGTLLAALVAASSLTPPVKVLFSWLLD